MARCRNCGREFPTRTGLSLHTTNVQDPKCRQPPLHCQNLDAPWNLDPDLTSRSVTGDDSKGEGDEDEYSEGKDVEDNSHSSPQYFQGDYFGNDYSAAELLGWGKGAAANSGGAPGDHEAADDSTAKNGTSEDLPGDDADLLEEVGEVNKSQWEAHRPCTAFEPELEGTEDAAKTALPAVDRTRRRRMESALRGKIYMTPFLSSVAGSPIDSTIDSSSGYCQYEAMLSGNIAANSVSYAPFKSQVNWEVARWAKLHGSG
ncbi:uncharacterized protein PHACADRAFT_33989 [Phanerochaete carnosa HHB-10118-sp]|uniref:Uncharacterized protein n=1 Tax=Phanerochaete carnosa (strain HHB-10118-sp) TaxID=650164 RepID=K5UFG5_PHACS|nr:uncharacterized protein PHACADRAFT_33989 [Phanerochaete carnosa HHB-10118-sp]EKM48191.1 hypothetical protein PHACADRAFT_33989 [Phanerochaete carnosa HHB-10118-sp]